MLVSEAWAQTGGGGSPDFSFLLMIVLLFVVMYFFMIRPQQKRARQHREMVAAVKRNDKIVTSGGLIGKVTKAGDGPEIEMEIAPDVKVSIDRNSIQGIMNKKPGGPGQTPSAANDSGERRSLLGGLFGGRRS
ncbi:MAG: preprotein translocase subunit YajC [Rhodospirillaceae bacterium]|nr:preprotein translocase subunit YajC [Rhodospirillaceae bacterium]